MANENNLIPTNKRSKEEARAISSKGGINSGISRRQKKTIADCLRKVLDEEIILDNGDTITRKEAITAKIIQKMFKDPDIRDLKTLSELLGEFAEKMEIKGEKTLTAKDAMALIEKIKNNV